MNFIHYPPVFILLILTIPFLAQAIMVPQIYITQLKIDEESSSVFYPGDEIEGSITLWNYEEFLALDLKLRFQLIDQGRLIDNQESNEVFTIPPKQVISKNFSYTIPAHAPSGELNIRIQVI